MERESASLFPRLGLPKDPLRGLWECGWLVPGLGLLQIFRIYSIIFGRGCGKDFEKVINRNAS